MPLMRARSPGIFILLFGLIYLVQYSSGAEEMLLWSQQSHKWTRIRGVYGRPEEWVSTGSRSYVGSEPNNKEVWHAMDVDPVGDFVYWHDRQQSTFYRQSVNDGIVFRQSNAVQTVYRGQSQEVTGLAVDWNTGAMYWTDDTYNLVAVSSVSMSLSTDVHRILFSTGLDRPVGIAVSPSRRELFWADAGGTPKIERSTLSGKDRIVLHDGEQFLGRPTSLTIDHRDNALYWVMEGNPTFIRRMQIDHNYGEVPQITLINGNFPMRFPSHGIATSEDYIFIANPGNYSIDIVSKTNGFHSNYIIDADPKDLALLDKRDPDHTVCQSLKCEHICVSTGERLAECLCGQGYYIEVDQRTCIRQYSTPRYIYSRSYSLWKTSAQIEEQAPHKIVANASILTSGYDQVQAIAFDYRRSLLFFNDVTRDVIYKIRDDGTSYPIITVNTRQVEGMAVDWLTGTLFWGDAALKHIMCSQLDGRYHKILIPDAGRVRGLAVDPVHGVLFWADPERRAIMRARMDGSGVTTLVMEQVYDPQGITVDSRRARIYWTDRGLKRLLTAKLDGTDRAMILMEDPSQQVYDATILQDYATWTQGNERLQFAFERTGEMLTNIQYNADYVAANSPTGNTYDVVAYDTYLQPDAYNPCEINNGGCSQLCFPTPPSSTPSRDLTASCGCAIGYSLMENKQGCVSHIVYSDFVLFTDPYHKQIYQHNMTRTETVQAVPVTSSLGFPVSVGLDTNTGRVFWIDSQDKEIRSSEIYGGDTERLHAILDGTAPARLAVDDMHNYVYYTDPMMRSVVRISYNARTGEPLETTNVLDALSEPFAIDIDVDQQLLFFTEIGTTRRVNIYDLNTKQRRTISTSDEVYGVTVPKVENNTLVYWCDRAGFIYKYDMMEERQSVIYRNHSLNITSITASEIYLFFGTWNEKGVYRLYANSSGQLEVTYQELYARITDVHAYIGLAIPPPVPAVVPAVYIGSAAAALALLALLIGLLGFCATRRRTPKAVPPPPEDGDIYENDAGDGEVEFMNHTALESALGGSPNGIPYDNGGTVINGFSTGFDDDANGITNGYTNGGLVPPSPPPPAPLVAAPALVAAAAAAPLPPPPPDDSATLAAAVAGGRRRLKPTDKKVGANNPATNTDFEMRNNQKVATVIQRLAHRMRNRLSTIRWNGDNPENKRKSKSLGGANATENWIPDTDVGTAGGGEVGDARTKKTEQKKYKYEPQLHRLPRGFAPASPFVPQQVKATWSKAKRHMYTKKSGDG